MTEQQELFPQHLGFSPIPRYAQLPALELYKDQVVELINRYLGAFYLDARPLTDTMVNNYVKLKVLAPPVKKRYRREQLAQLVIICLLKKVLSIAEIRQLLILEEERFPLEETYDYICQELERSVPLLFDVSDSRAEQPQGSRPLLDHAIWSAVHKLYFELLLKNSTRD